MGCLFLYIAVFRIRIYKNWFINAMEIFTYFKIITMSIFTWYTIDTQKKQATVTNISVAITFIQLLLVISYHVYKYTNHKVFSRIQETAVCKKLNEMSEQGSKRDTIVSHHLMKISITFMKF